MKNIFWLFLLGLTVGCTGTGFQTLDPQSFDLPSQEENTDQGGSGALQLQFTSPLKDSVVETKFKVSVTAEPLSELKELKLFINGKEYHRFTRVPFEVLVDHTNIDGCLLTLKAQSLDKKDRPNYTTLQVKKYETCSGTPGGGTDPSSSKSAGTFDANCLNNNTYDACIFWKNPVAQKGSAYSPAINFGQNLAEQTFGIKLTGMTDPQRLSNDSITVFSSQAPEATPSGNGWRFPYKDDASNHYVAQVMAYFWLSYQEQQMISRTGKFYAANKSIPVDAYNSGVSNNAYWDTQKIVMGIAQPSSQGAHEMALSAEVYLHEMGHANFQFAVGRFLRDSNASGNLCLTPNGCVGAINEGQADFHFAMLFWDSSALGETFVNDIRGISQFGINRNPAATKTMQASEYYSHSNGEIHAMGSFYASVLWNIYNDPAMNKADFEKLFSAHLTMFTESSRFDEARDILIAQDLNLFNGKYKSLIQAAFAAKGI